MAAKFFTGLPLDGPDPECVWGNADEALAELAAREAAGVAPIRPTPGAGHSKPAATPISLGRKDRVRV